jgi:hypothetical protein
LTWTRIGFVFLFGDVDGLGLGGMVFSFLLISKIDSVWARYFLFSVCFFIRRRGWTQLGPYDITFFKILKIDSV